MGKSETTNESNEWTPSDQTEMHQLLREGSHLIILFELSKINAGS